MLRKSRSAVAPQRSHGKARVAALLEAGAAVIAEQGYEAATMAEIAEQAKAPIGSLYRFFPSKEILAHALMERYVSIIHTAFDAVEAQLKTLSTTALADILLDFIVRMRSETKAMRALLEARADWSDKRLAFRKEMLRRIIRILMRRAPKLARKEATSAAYILLQNMKTMSALAKRSLEGGAGAAEELRLMHRLYLSHKLEKRGKSITGISEPDLMAMDF